MSTDYSVAYGTHAEPHNGRCAMEWVSYLANEAHSDEPACVSPALRAFCIALNDGLEHRPRQRLRPYLARTIGTAGDGLDEQRAWMAMDWLIRTHAPTWLSLAGLPDAADRLRMLSAVVAVDRLPAARDALAFARRQARGAWGTGPRAWLPPRLAARVEARELASAPTASAAWAAARVGIRDMAAVHARAAARAAAGDAAATVVRDALARAGRSAAPDVVRAALTPTRLELQKSAFALLDRMLPTVPLAPPVAADAERLLSAYAVMA